MRNLKDSHEPGQHPTPVRAWRTGLLGTLGIVAAIAGVIGGGFAVAGALPTDAVDITDVPVATFADQNKPNVMLLLDTSDSMKWSHMPDDWEVNATTYFPMGYKSALCNTLYYNPLTEYSLPTTTNGIDTMPLPSFTSAWKDGYDQSLGTVNLATSFQAYDGDTRRRNFYNDPAQPAYYFDWVANAVAGRPAPHFEDPTEVAGACNKTGIASVQADDGTLAQSPNIPGVAANGSILASPSGKWVRTPIPAAQQQNFAIWYSYYRTRINMAKSSVSLAFGPLNDNFRVGFLTVANPDASNNYSKFVPVKDFGGTNKIDWFSAIQSIKTGGTSPAREALARVGRYYAGKNDSINSSMTPYADPVVSACQRHYTIVTTDGYWNIGQESASGGPLQIDGTTLVGQQDGPPRSLTGADGLIPRPIYDGSTSGYKVVRDASVTYSTAPCNLGWKITTPGGGTKTETIYKKIIEKDVMTQNQLIADFTWWNKRTRQQTRNYAKITDWNFPKSERPYWTAQGTGTVTRTQYQQKILYTQINLSKYRYKATTTWNTQTQTPYSKATAQKVEQKKYFYWYRNPAQGETDLKTTNQNVCKNFPSGCNLQGNDTWAVVQSCSPTNQDAQGFKIECQTSSVAVNYVNNCPANNGQFIAGVGTITCEGSSVPPYTGPVPSCNVIHPTLAAAITAAGGDLTKVTYSACPATRTTAYVTEAQCVNTAPTQANGYQKTTCAKETAVATVVNNACTITTPQYDAATGIYTACDKVNGSALVAQCVAGPLADTPTQMERQCLARTVSGTPTQVTSCTPGVSGAYVIECSGSSISWVEPINPATCVTNAAQGKSCATRYGGYTASPNCTPEAPSAANGWVGRECANASQGTCTPAAGTENIPIPANGATPIGSCLAQGADASNGCIQISCNTNTSGPTKVATCTPTSGTVAPYLETACAAANEPNTPVQTCSGGAANMSNCRPFVVNKDMAYGSCENALTSLPGGGATPSASNYWTTSSCSKVDASTAGGLTYLQTADAFAQCQAGAGTNADGVKTTCTQDTVTVNVPQGQLCINGYDPLTNKVTNCAGIGQGTSVIVPTKPANCPAATCEEYKGNKKIFTGTAWSNRINLLGTAESGVPVLVNPPGVVPLNGDLESPSVCYPPEQLSSGATLQQPPNGKPQPGTTVWAALPATHQSCTSFPCEQVMESNVAGGSSNSLADVAQYYYATDLRPGANTGTPRGWDNLVKPAGTGAEDDKATWQHMATYVIGMGVSGTLKYDKDYKNGAGDFAALRTGAKTWPVWPPTGGAANYEQPQSIDDFWHTAVNGRGRYFSANDPRSIESGLGQVFADIRAAVGSGAGVAVTSAVVEAGNNFAYGAMYRSGSWTGDVLAYTIDVNAGNRSQITDWSAKARLDARDLTNDDRTIYFMTPSKALMPFKWGNLGALQSNFDGATPMSKLVQYSQMSAAQKTAATGPKLVDFLRGDRSAEAYTKNDVNKLYRTRDSRLGDIIGSQPLYVSKPSRKYKDTGYASFRIAQSSRKPMVYAGANDGMLHAFYAETDLTKTMTVGVSSVPVAAREAWAFVPTAVMPEMPRLASTDYESTHRYFVDGSAVSADIKVGTTWKTILVGGFNKGGKGYYALDITNPEAPVALWESNISTMGQSFGKPMISKLADGTWAVFVTSGYNNADGVGRAYVLNANTGAVIQTMTTTGSGLKELNNYVADPAGDNTTTLFYGGDLEGNVWRFQWDFNSSSFTTKKVVQLQSSGGTVQPITNRIELVQGQAGGSLPRILVATGKLLGVGDLSSTAQQSIYGFDDTADGYSNAASLRASLKQTLMEDVAAADGTRSRRVKCNASNALCADNSKGWYVDLPTTGERVNIDLRLAGATLVVASNIPSNEPCVSGGTGWINYLNFQTGGAVGGNTGEWGPSGVPVDAGLIMGNDLSATRDGNVTSHVSPSQFPNLPIDVKIPTSNPKPKGKRMSWREVVK